MSKIGKKLINLGEKVSVTVDKKNITIEGPEGKILMTIPSEIDIETTDKTIWVKRKDDSKKAKSLHGLYRQLINNAIIGVERLWQKQLEIVGTGYNVQLKGEDLVFKLGYSHPVLFKKVPGIKFQVEGGNKIIVKGVDKQLVGQVAYQIKMLKRPDVYKGKGIRYKDEKLRIKPGKKVKGGTVS